MGPLSLWAVNQKDLVQVKEAENSLSRAWAYPIIVKSPTSGSACGQPFMGGIRLLDDFLTFTLKSPIETFRTALRRNFHES